MTTIGDVILNVAVYHGSDRIVKVEDIVLPGPRKNYDFGPGFYLTDSRQIAEEWMADEQASVVNEYRLSIPRRDILYLKDRDWLQVVVGFRSRLAAAQFKSPVIHGLIADDRLVDSIEIFRQGAIGDLRLFECLRMVELGHQYMLRSCTDCLTWVAVKEVKGVELQRAVSRRQGKRINLEKRVQMIYKKQIPGELFFDDFLEMGAFNEI